MTCIVRHGDCLKVMAQLALGSLRFDAIVTDPPYHLTTGKKGGSGEASLNLNSPAGRSRVTTGGFMGKHWDGGDVAFQVKTWRLAYDILKPGAHLVAFGGTRTVHRMAVAIEDSGFEIRDTLAWLYGQGFPKHKHALKPSYEPIILARRPLEGTVADNVLIYGTGAMNIDACRIPTDPAVDDPRLGGNGSWSFSRTQSAHTVSLPSAELASHAGGRWPANLLHDGSDEVLEAFAVHGKKKSGALTADQQLKGGFAHPAAFHAGSVRGGTREFAANTGTAARFYYAAKATKADRAGSKHPTVKPLSLLRWLCTLVCPPGGMILDPFAGSGTTLQAAIECGFRAMGIEAEAEYYEDILRRMAA